MKPLPAPNVPGNTPWEKMDNAMRMVLKVPKEAVLKQEAKEKRQLERKKKKRGYPDLSLDFGFRSPDHPIYSLH
jgi:hypothetical protein